MNILQAGLIVVTIGMALPAAAEDRAAARQAFSDGSKYYDLNQYSEALEAFKKAYWNYENAVFLFNIAQCHRALKHKREAIESYRSYLRKAPNAPNRIEVQRIIADLDAALAQEKSLASSPPKATILREDKPASTPSEANLDPATGIVRAPSSPPNLAPPASAAASPAISSSAPLRSDQPLGKRRWFWGVTGAAIVVVAGVAVGIALAETPRDPAPSVGSLKVNQ